MKNNKGPRETQRKGELLRQRLAMAELASALEELLERKVGVEGLYTKDHLQRDIELRVTLYRLYAEFPKLNKMMKLKRRVLPPEGKDNLLKRQDSSTFKHRVLR